jgi:hypothetical protein
MTDKDKLEFGKFLAKLRAAYHNELGRDTLEVYFEALQDYSLQDIQATYLEIVQTLKFFPKIAEIIELVRGDPGNRWLLECDQHQDEVMSTEEAKTYLKQVYDRIGPVSGLELKPTLEGDEAKDFEQKRVLAKRKALKIVN